MRSMRFSGESSVLRVDIAMDQGLSANPLVDLGQVEGALIMSLGYFLTEEVAFGAKDGAQLGRLRIVGVQGVRGARRPSRSQRSVCPRNAELRARSPFSDRASGEPAMALGAACACGARRDQGGQGDGGLPPSHDLTLPLTVERVQMACGVP